MSIPQRKFNVMKSWDDVMDYCDSLPAYQQYALSLRIQDAVKTAEQLLQYGVNYPVEYDTSYRKSKT